MNYCGSFTSNIFAQALSMHTELVDNISKKHNSLFIMFPVSKYLSLLYAIPEIASYHYISNDMIRFCDSIEKRFGADTSSHYNKLLLLTLIIAANKNVKWTQFNNDIIRLYLLNFKRIISQIVDNSYDDDYYNRGNDKFCKDLAVSCLRMIPVGSRKIHLYGIPKTFLFKGKIHHIFNRVLFILFNLKGFKPLYEMHTDSHDPDLMAEFNPEGFIRSYKRIAGILKENPRVKGAFAGSWFYDPQIASISPRLAYLREIITDNGGKVFYMGDNKASTQDALLKSPMRRKLFEEKKYIPRVYMIIWPRKNMLQWTEKI